MTSKNIEKNIKKKKKQIQKKTGKKSKFRKGKNVKSTRVFFDKKRKKEKNTKEQKNKKKFFENEEEKKQIKKFKKRTKSKNNCNKMKNTPKVEKSKCLGCDCTTYCAALLVGPPTAFPLSGPHWGALRYPGRMVSRTTAIPYLLLLLTVLQAAAELMC